jgi:hypothetical protein
MMSPHNPLRVAFRAITEDSDGTRYPADPSLFQSYLEFYHLLRVLDKAEKSSQSARFTKWKKHREAQPEKDKELWRPFFRRAEEVSLHRKFAVTRHGHAAMVPKGTREGDVVCAFRGSPVPHVLRPVGDGT